MFELPPVSSQSELKPAFRGAKNKAASHLAETIDIALTHDATKPLSLMTEGEKKSIKLRSTKDILDGMIKLRRPTEAEKQKMLEAKKEFNIVL